MEISLAGWSLHRRFQHKDNPLALLDYPQLARDEFGICAVELNSPYFVYKGPQEQAGIAAEYLDELRARAESAGVRLLSIAVDGDGDLAAPDEAERKRCVEAHRKWFDICRKLGCTSFRANSGGHDTPDRDRAVEQCIKSFRELAAMAEETGIRLLMENHGGVSQSPDTIVEIMQAVDSDCCRVLADFLNWPPEEDKLANLRKIAPYAWATHAKFLSFDESGESNEIDCAEVMEIFRDAGYSNPFGIEYEGPTDDHEGVLKSKALLERYAY